MNETVGHFIEKFLSRIMIVLLKKTIILDNGRFVITLCANLKLKNA